MDLKVIHHKLEVMSEQITKVRESTARTEAVLAESLRKYDYLNVQVENMARQQNQWKGAMVVVSAVFTIIATVIARMVPR